MYLTRCSVNEPRQATKCLRACTKCEVRLSCASAKYLSGVSSPSIHSVVSNDSVSGDPDQTARNRRLILAVAVRVCLKKYFRMVRP